MSFVFNVDRFVSCWAVCLWAASNRAGGKPSLSFQSMFKVSLGLTRGNVLSVLWASPVDWSSIFCFESDVGTRNGENPVLSWAECRAGANDWVLVTCPWLLFGWGTSSEFVITGDWFLKGEKLIEIRLEGEKPKGKGVPWYLEDAGVLNP